MNISIHASFGVLPSCLVEAQAGYASSNSIASLINIYAKQVFLRD